MKKKRQLNSITCIKILHNILKKNNLQSLKKLAHKIDVIT